MLCRTPERVGVFSDFDGTLAPIVDDPATSAPLPGAVDGLAHLAGRVGRVGVLSGRPLEFLEQFFADGVFLAGLYGLEVRDATGSAGTHRMR